MAERGLPDARAMFAEVFTQSLINQLVGIAVREAGVVGVADVAGVAGPR